MTSHTVSPAERHPASPPDIVIAVLTYRRPDCLRRILPALADQARRCTLPVHVLVIDNDPSGDGAVTVQDHLAEPGTGLAVAVRYVHEPTPGIAAARNRALDEARDARALVFIDDDELPSHDWLELLVDAWQNFGSTAVSGPVVADFGDLQIDAWVMASGAFEPRHRRDGATVPGAATNNLLLDLAAVHRLELRFDPALGLVGGEDTLFTHQLVARGGEIRWCAAAHVVEPVAAERATRRWVLRRAYRAGTSWSVMELALARSRRARAMTRVSLAGRGIAQRCRCNRPDNRRNASARPAAARER